MTPKTVTLKVANSQETMTIPVYTGTKVEEVKMILGYKLGKDPGELRFLMKQGCSFRDNLNIEEVARTVIVHGIRSFQREKQQYYHPHAIIGAGHLGLKTAMTWLCHEKNTNFVLFDRRPEVGGTSWWQQANSTSRLQTEVGVYHLQYHETHGIPADAQTNPWPSRDQLLKHFKEVSEEYGLMPYCKMNTDVCRMSILGRTYWEQSYELCIRRNGEESIVNVSSVCFYPGNLTNPKRVTYKGEELFDGDIVYGISNEFDYARCAGNRVSIIGSGAFSVENVRTCVESGATKIFMICRRKTLAMPRVVSWFCNQSLNYISAVDTLNSSMPMYNLINVDPWTYYAVFANEARTQVTIRQKSRFGIGDVYFLSMYYGHTEHIVDDVKRVSFHKIHLMNGRNIEDVTAMLKLLGFNGEFENDRLLKIKELYGWWANKDHRRYIVAEPLGVDANNFGGTSFSPGALQWAEQQVWMLNHPADWPTVMDGGQLPSHVADESIDRPAYVVEARHGALTGISLGALVPGIGERMGAVGWLSKQRQWDCHPLDKYLDCCRREWYMWNDKIRDLGYDRPTPEYPYTMEIVTEYLEWEQRMLKKMEADMLKRQNRS